MTIGSKNRKQLQSERWEVMRAHGVPCALARDARSSSGAFTAALATVGIDAAAWPQLTNTDKAARKSYSTSKTAVETRSRRAVLKAAGLDWKRIDRWARSDGSTEYALRQIRAGRIDCIPPTPGMLNKSSAD